MNIHIIPRPKCRKDYTVKCLSYAWNPNTWFPSWEAIIPSLFILPEIVYYHVSSVIVDSLEMCLWDFLSCFSMLSSLSYRFLKKTRSTSPEDFLPKASVPLVDTGFIFFATPVSALAGDSFAGDSWSSQSPSSKWWMRPTGATVP